MARSFSVLLCLLAACDPAPMADAGALDTAGDVAADAPRADGGVDAPVDPSVVTVTYVNQHHGSAGTVDEQVMPGPAPVRALVESGGTFTTIAPSDLRPGGFVVRGVAAGATVYLQLGIDFVVTSARVVDLGNDVVGRTRVRTAANFSTSVALDLTGLEAWDTASDIEIISSNAGLYSYSAHLFAASPPTVGATSTSMSVMWYGQALVDGTMGDRLFVSQLMPRTSPAGSAYLALTRAFESGAGFMVTDTGTNTLAGAMTTPAADSLDITWRRAAFDALGSEVHPMAGALSTEGGVAALGAPATLGALRPYGHVVRFQRGSAPTDETLTGVAFANPYPGPLFGYALETWALRVALPGAGATVVGAAVGTEVIRDGATMTLAPGVTPARNVRVAGMLARGAPVTGVGTTPLVEWEPGTTPASSYVVAVNEVSAEGGLTRIGPVGAIVTSETSVRIPPFVMTAGRTYMLLVRAVLNGVDVEAHPFRRTLPSSSADTLTDFIQP